MVGKFIQVIVPPAVESPHGAEWAANVVIAIARFISRRPAVEASATRTPGHAAVVSLSAGGIT
jgi:hypothetical protein